MIGQQPDYRQIASALVVIGIGTDRKERIVIRVLIGVDLVYGPYGLPALQSLEIGFLDPGQAAVPVIVLILEIVCDLSGAPAIVFPAETPVIVIRIDPALVGVHGIPPMKDALDPAFLIMVRKVLIE